MGREDERYLRGVESFRVRQQPIVLGEPPHSRFHTITPEAIAVETLRLFNQKGKDELTFGLKPEVVAAVASQVSHMGFRFQDVVAAIVEEQLHLSGKIKKGPVTLLRGKIVVANGRAGLEVIDGSLGPLTRLVGNFNGIISEEMGASLGPEFTVDQIKIAESILTARIIRQQQIRRAA